MRGVPGLAPPFARAHPPRAGGRPSASGRKKPRQRPHTPQPPPPLQEMSACLTLIGVPWSPPRSWLHTALAESGWRASRLASHALIRSSAYLAVWAGGPMATLQTYVPRCLGDLERFFARPAKPAGIFQHSPGGVPHQNLSVCAGASGGSGVLTPGSPGGLGLLGRADMRGRACDAWE
jgi:hypothetical protein